MLWSSDAILTGEIAAAVSFWPTHRVDVVSAIGRCRSSTPGFAFERRTVPATLVWQAGGLRFTSPALTALDLCVADDGGAIDEVLRTRAATLSELRTALASCPGRRDNPRRQRLLLDSRDEPWSAAERCAHRLLRREGITGWRSNHRILAGGRTYYLDIAFPGDLLAVEIDGRSFHDDPFVFESDRHRQNGVTLAGWTVLRFTWRMLQDAPDRVAATIDKLSAVNAGTPLPPQLSRIGHQSTESGWIHTDPRMWRPLLPGRAVSGGRASRRPRPGCGG